MEKSDTPIINDEGSSQRETKVHRHGPSLRVDVDGDDEIDGISSASEHEHLITSTENMDTNSSSSDQDRLASYKENIDANNGGNHDTNVAVKENMDSKTSSSTGCKERREDESTMIYAEKGNSHSTNIEENSREAVEESGVPGSHYLEATTMIRAASGAGCETAREISSGYSTSHHHEPPDAVGLSNDNDEEECLSVPSSLPSISVLELSQPGAYAVLGDSVERAGSVSQWEMLEDSDSSRDNNCFSNVPDPLPCIAVAAELSANVESRSEDEARERPPDETTQVASVVAVEDEKSIRFSVGNKDQYKHRNFKEKLFGDSRKGRARPEIANAPDQYIRSRDVLTWNIQQDTTTKNWVARVQTNPKAKNPRDIERSLRFFRADNESVAYETGLANAPPQMQPYEDNPLCFLCQSKFAVFRRPCHCKNCGVVVCRSCSTAWPSKMLPETFLVSTKDLNIHNVSVCLACDWLEKEFRQASLNGDFQKCQSLYATGNINLRTPFCLEKRGSEVLYPIHMAITSGNMELVRWMASDRACPLSTNSDKSSALVTGKGRTPIQLALSRLDILQFLIVEKGLQLDKEDLDYSTVVTHLSSLLKTISPRKVSVLSQNNPAKCKKEGRSKKSPKNNVAASSSASVTVVRNETNAPLSQRRGSF